MYHRGQRLRAGRVVVEPRREARLRVGTQIHRVAVDTRVLRGVVEQRSRRSGIQHGLRGACSRRGDARRRTSRVVLRVNRNRAESMIYCGRVQVSGDDRRGGTGEGGKVRDTNCYIRAARWGRGCDCARGEYQGDNQRNKQACEFLHVFPFRTKLQTQRNVNTRKTKFPNAPVEPS